jgi:hypothetical protein
MIHRTTGRAAFVLAIGLGLGFAGPSWAADPQTDAATVTAPANPFDAQAAPANPAAGAEQQQLNDADRAARPDDVRTPVVVTQAQSRTETPPARANPVVAGSQNASWDETSLIGKIFIGFGALLTVASAARMFMA